MRPRDERGHPVVQSAIDQGFVGTGQPFIIRGFPTRQAAEEGRKSVNAAAKHLGVSCSSRQGEHVIDSGNGTFELHFRLFSKNSAREYIARTTGGDPSKLAYNPYQRAAPRIMDDNGVRLR
jgi:hypothetical protein